MDKNNIAPALAAAQAAFEAGKDGDTAQATKPVLVDPTPRHVDAKPASNAPDGETLSKLFSDFLSNRDKSEGISARMLKVMLDNEVRFSMEWINGFYGAEKGSTRTDMLNEVIYDFMDDFTTLQMTAEKKPEEMIGDVADPKKREVALNAAMDAKVDAQKRIKTLQNILRACIQGLFYLRSTNASDMIVRKGKLVFDYVDEESGKTKEMRPMSFNELCTAGSKRHNQTKNSRAPRQGSNAPTGTTATTKIDASISDALRYTIDKLKDADLDKLSEREQELVRALEALLIAKSFGDSNGVVNGKDVADYYNGTVDYRTELTQRETEKAA